MKNPFRVFYILSNIKKVEEELESYKCRFNYADNDMDIIKSIYLIKSAEERLDLLYSRYLKEIAS